MNQLDTIALTSSQAEVLDILRHRLFEEFDVASVILFGSVARGEEDAESDLDVLIVTKRLFSRVERHEITDIVFDRAYVDLQLVALPTGVN